MAQASELIGRLAALLCDGEEVDAEDLRDVLAEVVEPMMTDPTVGPAAVVEWAFARANDGHAQVWLYPGDAPRVAWELGQAEAPVSVCCVLGYPAGRALSDALCFETALMMEAGIGELAVVANTGAALEGTLDEVVEPVVAVLGTAHADDEECDCHDEGCECAAHHHHHDGDCECGCHEAPAVSVMIECGLMGPEYLCRTCDLLSSTGPDFVVAATGLGSRTATAADVRLLCATVEPGVGVKATTDATTLSEALELLEAGACGLVATAADKIMGDYDRLVGELDG